MSAKSAPIVVDVNTWVPSAVRFTPPKVNDKQGKSINIISNQTGRGLHISTPLMTTWGISDFVDPTTGASDGKFSISLTFPNGEYANKNTNAFLEKLVAFEQAILNEAVNNSELWWGEKLTLEVLKYSFFPILKYPKIKGTKKADMTKSPTLSAKVPFYEKENKWNVELYSTTGNLIFPCENDELTPAHFVPKLSNVACVLQCGGIWIGGKGWGVTWKLVQAVVKPKETVSVFGKCHISLSEEDKVAMETDHVDPEDAAPPSSQQISADVADSDDEEKPAPKKLKVGGSTASAPAPVPVVEKPVEKPAEKPAPASAPEEKPAAAPVKKIIKKVAPK
jgi:hypothetical protein